MSEQSGGPDFNVVPGTRESSLERLSALDMYQAALNILGSSEDLASRELADKLLAKAAMKRQASEMVVHANDVTVYQEFKKLGIFVVRDAAAKFDYEDPESGLSLRTGDHYLDLHLPPVPEDLRSRDAVEASMDLISQYAELHDLHPKYVMGITYGQLARVAELRFGFTTAYPDANALPQETFDGIARVFRGFTQAGGNGADIGRPVIVFREFTPASTVQN